VSDRNWPKTSAAVAQWPTFVHDTMPKANVRQLDQQTSPHRPSLQFCLRCL